ncbi:GNAT family N-acetyltransferase [bacterium]|nr:GNAT family N-acetyltransferase [bacterium]
MSDVTIRPAKAHDAEQAAPLIYSSGPAAFNYLLHQNGYDPVAFLRHSFARANALFGYRHHAVAVHEDRVVGTIAYYTKQDLLRINLFTAIDMLLFFGPVTGTKVVLRGLHMERYVRPPKSGCLYLAHIGVDPILRSQGIGSKLIDYALHHHPRGQDYITSLDVALTNPRAQALYERLGFEVIEERGTPAPTVPSHRYMERKPRGGQGTSLLRLRE